jgi:hypothetical protein
MEVGHTVLHCDVDTWPLLPFTLTGIQQAWSLSWWWWWRWEEGCYDWLTSCCQKLKGCLLVVVLLLLTVLKCDTKALYHQLRLAIASDVADSSCQACGVHTPCSKPRELVPTHTHTPQPEAPQAPQGQQVQPPHQVQPTAGHTADHNLLPGHRHV